MKISTAQKVSPREGDTRTRTGFLWLPKKLDGEWRWLERATWKQVRMRLHTLTPDGCGYSPGQTRLEWVSTEWVPAKDIEWLCAQACQALGVVGAPQRVLDALGDGTGGTIGERFKGDTFLPVHLEEFAEVRPLMETAAEHQRLKDAAAELLPILFREWSCGNLRGAHWRNTINALADVLRQGTDAQAANEETHD